MKASDILPADISEAGALCVKERLLPGACAAGAAPEATGMYSRRPPEGAFPLHAALRLTLPWLLLTAFTIPATAAVSLITGPTPIINGDARAPGDITVMNERLAFALAVESPAPYGVPRGAIVDVAPVRDGQVGRDHTVFADFIPNNWSAWPNTYHRVSILERGPDRAVVQAVRDWGKVTITTTYTLATGSDHIEIHTTMHNEGDTALPDLLSGLTLWPQGGFIFPVPGMASVTEGAADAALSDRVTAYDADWAITLHAPYFDHVGDGSRDLYVRHTLAPGDTRTFDGWLQVGPRGDLAPVVRAEIERKSLVAGNVLGVVTDRAGHVVDEPIVIAEREHKPFAWAFGGHDGHYELPLPEGDYTLYATGKNRSQSTPVTLRLDPKETVARDFHDLDSGGRLQMRVKDSNGAPLDSRVTIKQGQRQLVQFLGRQTFFTDLDAKGHADLVLAPGDYVFEVAWGGGFFAAPREVSVTLGAGATQPVSIVLTRQFDARSRGWFAADLHHHADQAEAVTPPSDLARSQLAAGLDLLFVSDHDSTVNHAPLEAIARRRGIPFIPSLELSPSWGHFNAYPLTPSQRLAIDTSAATVTEVFKEARRQGALVIQANHPFIPYGYFASLEAHVAPGGFDPGFDLVEINATVPEDDDKVLRRLRDFWNDGKHYYLVAGTDTHDVWSDESGRIRTFAHVAGKLTPQSFAQALLDGHAYVSRGPLVFPSVPFGNTLKAVPGKALELGFELDSVVGLRRAELVGGDKTVATREFPQGPRSARVNFRLPAVPARWYQLLVEDNQGHKAYTDPVWVASGTQLQ